MREQRIACAVITHIETGEQILWQKDKVLSDALQVPFEQALRARKSQRIETEAGQYFINLYLPEPRMVIIGAVHIAQALVSMAKLSDYEIIIIDPRTAFATQERFPDVTLYGEWPQDIWDNVKLDAHTALIALTHDPKVDDWPLQKALEADCFYVGALGSRKTHGKRCERLAASGVSETALERIHAPIGLNIGASNPVEIAVAILAQVIEAHRI